MIVNAMPLTKMRLENVAASTTRKSAAARLRAVASNPGPRPPIPAEISTGGMK